MGLFDLFKKKKQYDKYCPKCGAGLDANAKFCNVCGKNLAKEEVVSTSKGTVNTSRGTVDYTVTITKPNPRVKEKGKYVRNGITYKTIETIDGTGGCFTSDVPEYNEVLVYYTFLNKYPSIKKPELLREPDYPHSMFSRVGITEVKKVHMELVSKGFYEKASNADVLSTYKVGEIKDVAAKLNLSVKGKKEDIINQIVSQANEYELSNILGDTVLSISSYGKSWMKDHEDEYHFYTSDKEFDSLEDYVSYRKRHDPRAEKRKECLKNIKQDKKTFGRYDYDTLIGLLAEEGNKKEITICYLKELLIDMSGALNYADWKRCDFDRDIIRECNRIVFTPFLLRTFPEYKQYYEPAMIDEVYALNLPIIACSKDDFKDIAEMMFDGTMDEDTRKMYSLKISKNLVELGLNKR